MLILILLEWFAFYMCLGGLFGAQKPATGFGSTFGAPASSATTGFGGLGTFTPAGGKKLMHTHVCMSS